MRPLGLFGFLHHNSSALALKDLAFERTAVNERSVGPLRIYCVLRLLCAFTALGLQMDRADVLLQVAGRPERHAIAVAADVVPALLVHRLDVCLQVALVPEGDTRAVGARVVAPRQTHRILELYA